ncbi:hypothetical protein [Streptomyces europaeiscabiei]|uniref:hypothetical protein n=1 Tax=Streptomyces europaeiscabiei TaxID=146819 RepID=UPI0029A4D6F0|nr:hypothetical protein [Streptomyces europaeiscabiei]MDX3867656.1 hypothetical protein [Streptomyces europaeiscabiei]MDX3876336.1 hypothetical protein [Streptomyces europaeiscabiei]
MPVLPGQRSQWISTLRKLIGELTSSQTASPNGQAPLPQAGGLDRHQLQRLVRSGLLSREGSVFMPSAATETWHRNSDPSVLIETLHINVRFVGEIMNALASDPRTHEQLLYLAREEYDLPWDTTGPVHNRTAWLSVTGMVDLFDGRLHLTDVGRNVLAGLALGRPEPDVTDVTRRLTPAVGVVADLIGSLDESALRARADGANLYIPGTSANGGSLDALQMLTEAAIPSIKDTDFVRFVQAHFPKAQTAATARTARETLKALGLIRRTSSETWSATPGALAWIEAGEPLDLARTVHASIAFFGEILGELDGTDRPTTGALAERSVHYLPNRQKPLARAAVNTRLNLLEACGLVSRLSQTVYRATPLGLAFKDSLICFSPEDATPPTSADSDASYEPGSHPDADRRAGSPGEGIATELEIAARDSSNHKHLEKAAVAALGYLGLPGEHVGGNGRVDGRVRFGIGADSPVLGVEAKSSATGRVVEQPLFGLAEHRAEIGAEVTLLIGPGFERRMLREADEDPAIAVIETGLLAEVVRRQEHTPLTLEQLAPLVDPALRATQRRDAISGYWQEQEIRSRLEYAVVDILNAEAEDPFEEGGWLDLTSIRRELRNRGYRVGEEEVEQALAFLAWDRIGVLQRSERGYRCTASVHTAGMRIRALGHQWSAAAVHHHEARSSGQVSQR